MVSKTLLISQLSYYLTIIKPDDEHINQIQTMIGKFCVEGYNIGKDRLYTVQ